VIDPKKRIYGVVFIENRIAQARTGDWAALIADILMQIKNANKMMEIRGIAGQVIWKPYVDLADLVAGAKSYVRGDTVYSGAMAHGIMRDPSDPHSWTGDVSINGAAVGYTLWDHTFTKAVNEVNPSMSPNLINCSGLGYEYADQIRKDLQVYFDRDRTK
jgi:hypothetical protein